MRPSRDRGRAGLGDLIDRRSFLRGSVGALLGTAVWRGGLAGGTRAASAAATGTSLEDAALNSEFVYVSPLKSNGQESTCHGEVWYGWLDGGAVLITSTTSWKARSLSRGLDRARVWVGDHGRWKGWLFNNEEFRGAPHFDARARRVQDPALLERLLAVYETKYPAEIDDWRDKMRSGYRDGSRILIHYTPEAA